MILVFLQTLPGIAVTYNGEEIGMTDIYIPWEKTLDPAACNTNRAVFSENSRDPARTPMQWDGESKNAGFSNADETWLPVGSNYKQINVKKELEAPQSHLKMFKKLVHLRKTEAALQDGTYESKVWNDDVVVYRRQIEGVKAFYVVLNFGKTSYEIDLSQVFEEVPDQLKVAVTSTNLNLSEGSLVASKALAVGAEVAMVLEA